MSRSLRVLLVEDSEHDAFLLERELRRGGYDPTVTRVDTAEAMEQALASQPWDVVVADFSLPRFDGLAALKVLQQTDLDLPFILVSGTIGEEIAVKAMRAGAHDYLMKDNLTRLVPAVQRELREAESRRARRRAEEKLRESEARYRQSVENSPNPIFAVDRFGTIEMWNRACERVFHYQQEEILGQSIRKLLCSSEDQDTVQNLLGQVWQGQTLTDQEMLYCCKDGTQRFTVSRLYPTWDHEGRVEACVFANTDMTERTRAEQLLQAFNEAALDVEQALTPQQVFSSVGRVLKELGFTCTVFLVDESQSTLVLEYVNYATPLIRAAERLLRMKVEDFVVPLKPSNVFWEVIEERKSIFSQEAEETVRDLLPGPLQPFAGQLMKIVGTPRSITAPLIVEDRAVGVLSVQADSLIEEDIPSITAFAHQLAAAWRKAKLLQDLQTSLEELTRTQAQFLQAQKMEAIGRLAGGVAHDFNNTLTVIHLSTRMLKQKLHPQDPLWQHVDQIEEASQRAANLTKQLLSFSRREFIEPRVINLNRLLTNLSQMLRRIIGEDIELVTILADDLWSVYLDPTQIDQVIVNLVVNARDAMPGGGRLTIETANCVLDETYVARHMDVQPGEYVMLVISDTGGGIDDEIKEHIFEPFYTTKERGRGTGLGLSTVFGVVKQNNGHISVYSEAGQGATFRIYLPRVEGDERQSPSPVEPGDAFHGSETILVVEDDPAVRKLTEQILKVHGYQVLSAAGGAEALRISQEYAGPIHLLLTDAVMPHMNGRELAEKLRTQRRETRILYMSGHHDDVIAYHGVVGPDALFLPKPLTIESLTRKVREALSKEL